VRQRHWRWRTASASNRHLGLECGNLYGASEAGLVAFDCGHGWLHVNADWVILEPVDAAYQPVPPGQPSRTVLVTNLANRVQPIIRYDLGDSVTICPCGDPLPAIRVEGRTDEILYLEAPDGTKIPVLSVAIATVVEETPGVRRYQVIQTGRLGLQPDLEAEPGYDEVVVWNAVERRLRNYLWQQGLPGVQIERDSQQPRRDPVSGKFRHVWAELTS
jgi:phenylacetate-CoA ligase